MHFYYSIAVGGVFNMLLDNPYVCGYTQCVLKVAAYVFNGTCCCQDETLTNTERGPRGCVAASFVENKFWNKVRHLKVNYDAALRRGV